MATEACFTRESILFPRQLLYSKFHCSLHVNTLNFLNDSQIKGTEIKSLYFWTTYMSKNFIVSSIFIMNTIHNFHIIRQQNLIHSFLDGPNTDLKKKKRGNAPEGHTQSILCCLNLFFFPPFILIC